MNRSHFLALLLALGGLITAHAGESGPWERISLPAGLAEKAFNSISFCDAQHGALVGPEGSCATTADGGKTWVVQTTGSGAQLRDVRLKDPLHGWACGDEDPNAPVVRQGHIMVGAKNLSGTLLSTEDGGKTWKNVWIPCAFVIPSVEVRTAPTLQFGVGGAGDHIDGDILRTDGAKWRSDRSYRGLFDIRALDDKRWVAVGAPVMVGFFPAPQDALYTNKACRILFSRDAGKTWEVSKGSDGRPILRRAIVHEGLPPLAVGDKGAVLYSEDGGENWTAVKSGISEDLRSVAYAEKVKLAVAVGKNGGAWASSDGGKTWSALAATGVDALSGIAAGGDTFFAVGAKGLVLRASAAALQAAAGAAPPPHAPAEKKGH